MKHYQVLDDDLKHQLHSQGYECCESCYGNFHYATKKKEHNPPKYALANGFVIGHLPVPFSFSDKNGEVWIRSINV